MLRRENVCHGPRLLALGDIEREVVRDEEDVDWGTVSLSRLP